MINYREVFPYRVGHSSSKLIDKALRNQTFSTSAKVEAEQVQLPRQTSDLKFSACTRTELGEGTSNVLHGRGGMLASFPLEVWESDFCHCDKNTCDNFFNVCVYRRSQRPEEVIGSYEPGVTGGYELTNVGARNWTWTLCKSKYLTIQLLLTSICDHSAISPVPRKSVEQKKLVKALVHCQLSCCLRDCGKASCSRSNKWQRKLFNLWKPGIKDKEKEEGVPQSLQG